MWTKPQAKLGLSVSYQCDWPNHLVKTVRGANDDVQDSRSCEVVMSSGASHWSSGRSGNSHRYTNKHWGPLTNGTPPTHTLQHKDEPGIVARTIKHLTMWYPSQLLDTFYSTYSSLHYVVSCCNLNLRNKMCVLYRQTTRNCDFWTVRLIFVEMWVTWLLNFLSAMNVMMVMLSTSQSKLQQIKCVRCHMEWYHFTSVSTRLEFAYRMKLEHSLWAADSSPERRSLQATS